MGDQISQQALLGLGVPSRLVQGNSSAPSAPADSQVSEESQGLDTTVDSSNIAAASDPQWEIGGSWIDKVSRSVVLRQGYWNGSSGWGWKKFYNYHNLTSASMRKASKNYFKYEREGETTNYRYWAQVVVMRCGWTCWVNEARNVKIINDRRYMGDDRIRGIFNGMCIQDPVNPECPDWVNRAFSLM